MSLTSSDVSEIKIFDDFLDKSELEKVLKRLDSPTTWEVQSSAKEEDKLFAGYFSKSQEFLYLDVTKEKYFNSYLLDKIKEKLDQKCELERVYFNGQWPGRDAGLHQDGCKYSALVYVGPYEADWGGFTQFVISHTKQYIIPPIQNRLIIFPGHIPHKGYSFSNQNCPMRISLAFKLL